MRICKKTKSFNNYEVTSVKMATTAVCDSITKSLSYSSSRFISSELKPFTANGKLCSAEFFAEALGALRELGTYAAPEDKSTNEGVLA